MKERLYILQTRKFAHIKIITKVISEGDLLCISDKQCELLKIIDNFLTSNNKSPTTQELQEIMGVQSIATLVYHLDKLQELGLIDKVRYKHRSIIITEKGRNILNILNKKERWGINHVLYVIIFISITLFISLIQFSKLMKPPKVQEKGKILCSWMTPNGMWLTTKMFIVGISLMFLLPKYTIIHTPNQVTNKSQNIIDLINSIEIEIMLPHQASTGDLISVTLI